jgi:hypothetical protein
MRSETFGIVVGMVVFVAVAAFGTLFGVGIADIAVTAVMSGFGFGAAAWGASSLFERDRRGT